MSKPHLVVILGVLFASLADLSGAVADIGVAQSASAPSVPLGTALTYTLTVRNAGPDTATDIVLTDMFPAMAKLVSAQTESGSIVQSGNTIECRFDSLASGASATLSLTVTPTSTGTFCNFARVFCDQTDPNLTNNHTTVCTTATAPVSGAYVSVSTLLFPDPAIVGSNVTCTIRVRNNGPGRATAVRLADILPTNATVVSIPPDCLNSGGVVSCMIPSLGRNASATRTIVLTPTAAGPLCHAVSVQGSQPDGRPDNNADNSCSEATIEAPAVKDLAIVKITAPATITLSARKPSIASLVSVQIQNRAPHNETISTLSNLVNLTVESLGLCADLIPELLTGPPQRKLPVILKPRQTLNIYFRVTFDTNSINDPLKNSTKSLGHEDFRYYATVHHEAIDGQPDTHPADDFAPRSVNPPWELMPNPDGKLRDLGAGKLKSDHTFGADVVTDLIGPGPGGPHFPTVTNHLPVAVNDFAIASGTNPVQIAVLANDSDPDGDPLTVTGFTQPPKGAVSFVANTARYNARAGFYGTDHFDYTISDGRGGTATAGVYVTVTNSASPLWETSEIGAVWSDDFNRTALGANWIVLAGANISLTGSELVFDQSDVNLYRQVYYQPWLTCSDQWTIRWHQRFDALNASSYGVGAGIRNFQAEGGDDRGYNAVLGGAGTGLGKMQIQRWDGAGQNPVAAGPAMALAAGDVVDCSLTRSGWTLSATASNRANSQISSATVTFSLAANLIAPTISRMCFYPLGGKVYVDDVAFIINHRKPARFLLVGASANDGYNASTFAKTQLSVIQSNFTETVCNDSGSYNSTSNAVSILPEILAHQPGTAILMLGGNDIGFGYPAIQWQTNYSSLVTQLQAAGVKVMHCLHTPRNGNDLRPLNDWILAHFPAADIIDTWTPLVYGAYQLNPAYDAGDGLHPNDAGHLLIGQIISAALK
jgi:uncharacterized repeat protein (TIGR01451 family)